MENLDLEKSRLEKGHSKRNCAIGVFAALITFLIYLPSLSNDFVNWDDQMYVYLNANIRNFDLEFLRWAFRTDMLNAYWHPLTMISYAIDYQILGLNPFQYHLTNAVFHALNTLVVFYIGLALYRAARPDAGVVRADAGAITAGLVTALLFGVHPLHVESVAWISERKDVLYAFFFLLSVLSYLRYARPQAQRKALYYALSLIFFILSVMSKPMAVTLPLILLILDWYPLGRFAGRMNGHKFIKTAVFEKLPFFAVSLLSGLLTITSMSGHGNVTDGLSFFVRAVVSVRGYMFYIYKMFLPFDLAPVYPYPQKVILFEFNTIAPAAAFILAAVLCLLTLRRMKSFTAAWLSYLVMLLPVIGIIQNGHQFAADRYTYLPLLGFFFIAGFGAARLASIAGGYLRFMVAVPALLVFIGLSYLTVKQEAVWAGPVSLWSRQIELYPGQPWIAHYFRALGYAKNGEFEKALEDYEVHMANRDFDPDDAVKYVERGTLYVELKDCGAALKDFETALKLKPEYASAVFTGGVLNAGDGRCREAIEGLRSSL